jgi:hypothetical protein
MMSWMLVLVPETLALEVSHKPRIRKGTKRMDRDLVMQGFSAHSPSSICAKSTATQPAEEKKLVASRV